MQDYASTISNILEAMAFRIPAQCQRKGKWLKRTRSAVVGDIAILKNELLPPLQWPLVRVTEIRPGQDGIVRAVTVRNSAGQFFSRPVVKLAFLPTFEDEEPDPAVQALLL